MSEQDERIKGWTGFLNKTHLYLSFFFPCCRKRHACGIMEVIADLGLRFWIEELEMIY